MTKIWMWLGVVAAAAGTVTFASGQGLPPGPMPVPIVQVGPQTAAKAANPVPSAIAKIRVKERS